MEISWMFMRLFKIVFIKSILFDQYMPSTDSKMFFFFWRFLCLKSPYFIGFIVYLNRKAVLIRKLKAGSRFQYCVLNHNLLIKDIVQNIF